MCLDLFSYSHVQWQGMLAALVGAVLGAGSALFACRYADLLGMALTSAPQQCLAEPRTADSTPCPEEAPGSLPDGADGYSLLILALAGHGWQPKGQKARGPRPLHYGCSILMALVVFMAQQKYGWGPIFWGVSAAAGIVCVLAIVDAKTALLPDALTLPLLWLGLALAWAGGAVSLWDAVGGAMAGYLFLWILFWLFKLVRGYDGMGHGDFKLFAALGAWLGWSALPYVLLTACLGGILFACIKQKRLTPAGSYPFGPFLALSGLAALSLGFCAQPG